MSLQPVTSAAGAAGAVQPIPVVLNGRALEPNRRIPLNVDWVEQVRVNTSAVERRAATHCARRSIKKEEQAAWLLRAIACMDLTTLSGDDSAERVRRLCAKARNPHHQRSFHWRHHRRGRQGQRGGCGGCRGRRTQGPPRLAGAQRPRAGALSLRPGAVGAEVLAPPGRAGDDE